MNGICEYEKGENLRTCISDCASDRVQFNEETKKLLKQNNDVIKDPKSGEVLLRGIQPVPATSGGGMAQTGGGSNLIVLIISGIILLLVGVGVWIFVKLRKRNKQYGL
jgi:LPXTG-motif cell wall-anchored protein